MMLPPTRQRVARPRGGGVALAKLGGRLPRCLGAGRQPAGLVFTFGRIVICQSRSPNVECAARGRLRGGGGPRGTRPGQNGVAPGDVFNARLAVAAMPVATAVGYAVDEKEGASVSCVVFSRT